MRRRVLIAALAAVVLPGAVASVSLYGHIAARAAATPAAEPPPVPASGDRIFLTSGQSRETTDRRVWPAPMRSLLNVDHRMGYGEWLWNDRGVPAGRTTVRVDLRTQLVSVARAGHEIGTAVILYGAQDHETPLGRFPILSKAADYHSRAYDAPMPFALRLTRDGVAIHGSDVRPSSATHGCIGLPTAFARKVFAQVERGDEVLIVR